MSFVAAVKVGCPRWHRTTSDVLELSLPFISGAIRTFFYRLDGDFKQLLVNRAMKRSVVREADHAGQDACYPNAKIDA